MQIGIIGLTDKDNIKAIEELGVDFIGLDFRADSERLVKMIMSRSGIIPDYSTNRITKLKEQILKTKSDSDVTADEKSCNYVGIFADDMPQTILSRIFNYKLSGVVLSGDEGSIMIDNLRRTIVPDIVRSISIIKELRIKEVSDMDSVGSYMGSADAFLFSFENIDVARKATDAYKHDIPYYIAFRKDYDDNDLCDVLQHDNCKGLFAEDVFETSVGIKNPEEVALFIKRFAKK